MSEKPSGDAEYLAVGHVVRPWGKRGEVVVEPLTDFPERFRESASYLVHCADGCFKRLCIETCRIHKGRPLVGFEGIDTIGAAETLRNARLLIPEEERNRLPDRTYYQHELEGLEARDASGAVLGRVSGVLVTGGCDNLVIESETGDILLPMSEEFVLEVAVKKGFMIVEIPDELRDLNPNAV